MQPQRAPPSASASLAATKAFVKNQESNPNLSNAAAAAALRANVTTPPPVGDTITKRMLRRNSQSSNGSGQVQQRPGGLQRQTSSGSMTERTFRSPSPGRGSPADTNAPPVPALPKNIPDTGAVHRRASSLEPPNRGGAPGQRGRGASLDRGPGHNTGGRGQRATSNLAQVLEDDQDGGNRSSVNFSRPMSPASAAKQNAAPQSGWFGGPKINQEAVQRMTSTSRPQTSSGAASVDLRNTQQSVHTAASRPVKTHQVVHGVEGSKLSSGSMRAKPSGTAVESRSFLPAPRVPTGPVDPRSPDAVFDPSTRTFVHKQAAMAMHREMHEEPEEPSHHYVAHHVEQQYPQRVVQRQPPPRTPSPVRQPLRYEETPEQRREEVLPRIDTSAKTRRPEDPPTGIPSRDSHAEAVFEREQTKEFADAEVQPSEQPKAGLQPTPIDVMVPSPKFAQNQDSSYPRLPTPVIPTTSNTLAGQGHGSARTSNDRGSSLSPPRNAHFAPVAIELAGIKHQPPPRSISPAKSALKSSPSVSRRGNSPVSQNGRLSSRGAPSEASDTTSDGGSGKKKAIRVSFEETPFITAPISKTVNTTSAPPTGLGASKWSPTAEKDNEFEDFMKPRPALPSFGSVREKEQRPMSDEAEKVTETVSSTPMTASVASVGEPLHTSNDHAIAGIVSQDIAKKQAAHNDPLPPEVTSVEGSGYVSDSSDEMEGTGLQKHGALNHSSQILPGPEPKSLTVPHEEKSTTSSSINETVVNVPDIALLPATPSPYERPEPRYQPLTIPGGWGDDDVPEAGQKATISIATTATQTQKAPAPAPAPVTQPVQQPTTLHELVSRDEDSSDDNSSIYSDAYEDMSDAEGGFGSIDAVANSPVTAKSSGLMFSKYADKGAAEPANSGLRNETFAQDVPPPVTTPIEDWDAARQHWSGLSEARRQPQHDDSPVAPAAQTRDAVDRVVAAPVKYEQLKAERKVEAQAAPVQKTASTPQPQVAGSSSKPLKSALKKAGTPQPAPAQTQSQSQPQIRKTMRGPPPVQRDERTAPQMRSSMRGPPGRDARSTESHMRASMRTGASPAPRDQPQMRTSMRGANPVAMGGAGLAASRHSMAPVEQKPPRGALQKRHIPANVQAANARPQSMPVAPAQRTAPVPTYDSDSDASASSFQKARGRRSGNQGGRYTMRASMRQDAAPTMRSAAPAPKTVRAISPPGSPAPAIRKSMRPSSPTPEVVKSSKFSIRSLSPMGRFRSSKPIEAAPPAPTQPRQLTGFSKQPKQKAPAPQPTKPAFSSRFADSSDEDDDGPSRFQSRFADSDDDEPADYALPSGYTPVRGIPRKAGEEDGDSTDLEEEVDQTAPSSAINKEIGSTAATNGSNKANGATNGQDAILATGSLRDSKHAPLPSFEGGGKGKAKRGFFGLGKKKTSAGPTGALPAADEPASPARSTTAPPSEIPMPPQQQKRNPGFPLTPIDEDKDIGTPVTASPQGKKAPKLQRRSTPEWPLPRNIIPVPPIPDDPRPMSSDGITPRRPRFANRQSSTMSSATAPDVPGRSVSYGRTGKKKKFQGLRRVFGLND